MNEDDSREHEFMNLRKSSFAICKNTPQTFFTDDAS